MTTFLQALVVALSIVAPFTWLTVVKLAPTRLDTTPHHVTQARVARLWLYAPVWVTSLIVLAAMMPAIASSIIRGVDHCLAHTDSHHHLCLWHPASHTHNTMAMLLPLFVIVPSTFLLGLTGWRIFQERRLIRTLVHTSRPSEYAPNVRLLDHDDPIALTVGWVRPTILLSTGIINTLTTDSLHAVLAHEHAHVRRRDTWLAALDRCAASILPQRVAKPLLHQIHISRELACDFEAAQHAEPLNVARALTEVARLRTRQTTCAHGTVEPRVMNLLTGTHHAKNHTIPFALLISGLVAAGAWPVHNVIEHVLNFLLH